MPDTHMLQRTDGLKHNIKCEGCSRGGDRTLLVCGYCNAVT